MLRVTLDTNIYVSALQYGGRPLELPRAGLEGEILIAISQPILDETLRVLRDKFNWAEAGLLDAKALIAVSALGFSSPRYYRPPEVAPGRRW